MRKMGNLFKKFFSNKFSNKKRILILSVMLVLICFGIAGTYFFDSDISKGNKFKMSTFDLKVRGEDDQGAIFTVPSALVGSSYTTSVPVKLNGTGGGRLYLKFLNIKNDQGEQTEPEIEAETAAGRPVYDLSGQIYVSVNGGTRSTLKEGLSKSVGNISAGETTNVVITFDIKNPSDENLYQGDVCTFDIAFYCEQKKL